jgi:hypothetical protein
MQVSGFVIKIRSMGKMFNKFATSCQMESEFVNHFVATSQIRQQLVPGRMRSLQPFKAAEKGMN